VLGRRRLGVGMGSILSWTRGNRAKGKEVQGEVR